MVSYHVYFSCNLIILTKLPSLLGRLTGRRPLDSMLMNAEEPFLPFFVEVVLSCFVCGIWPFGRLGFGLLGLWVAWALGCLGFGPLGLLGAPWAI